MWLLQVWHIRLVFTVFFTLVICELLLLVQWEVFSLHWTAGSLGSSKHPHLMWKGALHHRHLEIRPSQVKEGRRLTNKAVFTVPHAATHDHHFDRLYAKDPAAWPPLLLYWNKGLSHQCNGSFVGFGSRGAILHDVVLDRTKCHGPRGGEKFEDVMNQKEDLEYFKYEPGFFTLPCATGRPTYHFKGGKTHLHRWMQVLQVVDPHPKTTGNGTHREIEEEGVNETIKDFTIAITRYEYVNLYHTMTDYYNAFLVMAYLNHTQHQTNILILDGHPAGGLDSVWSTLFYSVSRLSQLPKRTCFKNLAFGILGYHSPLYVSETSEKLLPLAAEFRDFFLASYGLPKIRTIDCSKMRVLFIWRHNYVAHPRNPSGRVSRKIHNEDALVQAVHQCYPDFFVQGVQSDRFEMGEQVRMVASADILIGMHGAALSHMLFLQNGRAVIELMPHYVKPASRRHFMKMAAELNLLYRQWVNTDEKLEHSGEETTVPPKVVLGYIKDFQKDMCDTAAPVLFRGDGTS